MKGPPLVSDAEDTLFGIVICCGILVVGLLLAIIGGAIYSEFHPEWLAPTEDTRTEPSTYVPPVPIIVPGVGPVMIG